MEENVSSRSKLNGRQHFHLYKTTFKTFLLKKRRKNSHTQYQRSIEREENADLDLRFHYCIQNVCPKWYETGATGAHMEEE